MAIAFIAPVARLEGRPRLARYVEELDAARVPWRSYGWMRSGDASVEGSKTEHILVGGQYQGKWTPLWYLLWAVKVYSQVRRLGKEDVVVALGLETALPARLALGRSSKQRLVFDDADSITLIKRWPKVARRVLGYLEKLTARHCRATIVPSMERWSAIGGEITESIRVIPNGPTRELVERSRCRVASYTWVRERAAKRLVLLCGGRLSDSRGFDVLLSANDEVLRQEVLIVVAGRHPGPSALTLKESDNVLWLGELSMVDALALQAVTDCVLTFYDPRLPINRYAEANKWGDCLALKTPFVVNAEVLTAERYVQAGIAEAVPYRDIERLRELLIGWSRDRTALERMAANFEHPSFHRRSDEFSRAVMGHQD